MRSHNSHDLIVSQGNPPKGRCEKVDLIVLSGLYGFVVIDQTGFGLFHTRRVEWSAILTAQTQSTFSMTKDGGVLTISGGRTSDQRISCHTSYRRIFVAQTARDVEEGIAAMQTVSKLVLVGDNGKKIPPEHAVRSGHLATYLRLGRSVELSGIS